MYIFMYVIYVTMFTNPTFHTTSWYDYTKWSHRRMWER